MFRDEGTLSLCLLQFALLSPSLKERFSQPRVGLHHSLHRALGESGSHGQGACPTNHQGQSILLELVLHLALPCLWGLGCP